MDDYIGVLYIELLNRSLNRCIIDWKCFTDRISAESNKNNLRIALIQYCRGQREIFLKLKVLFDLVKYQKKVDKLLQYSQQYDQFMTNAIQDISRNVSVIENRILPAPNVGLSVDLLSTHTYSRMPNMIGEISKSSCDNTIPIMKLDYGDVDLCLNRLKIHFAALFRLSRCYGTCKVDFRNGVCHFSRDDFFELDLLYDFNQYQITRLKFHLSDHYVNNVVGLVNYILNFYLGNPDRLEGGCARGGSRPNVFDILYLVLNRYVGKLILKYLYKQAIAYSNNRHIVFNYNTADAVGPGADLKRGDSMDLERDSEEELRLDCYLKFRHTSPDRSGLSLLFTRNKNGDVDLKVPELDLHYSKIHNYHLDHWLQVVSEELNEFQLRVLGENMGLVEVSYSEFSSALAKKANAQALGEMGPLVAYYKGNLKALLLDAPKEDLGSAKGAVSENRGPLTSRFWMNRFNGALNFYTLFGEFNLREALYILKVRKVVGAVNLRYGDHTPYAFNHNLVNALKMFEGPKVGGFPRSLDRESGTRLRAEMEQEIDNNLVTVLLGGNKYILTNLDGNLHLVALYQVYPLLEGGDQVGGANEGGVLGGLKLVLAVSVLDYMVATNGLMLLDHSDNVLGTLELGCLYDKGMNEVFVKMLGHLLGLKLFANLSETMQVDSLEFLFKTDPVVDVNLVTLRLTTLGATLTFKGGNPSKFQRGEQELSLEGDYHPVATINQIIG